MIHGKLHKTRFSEIGFTMCAPGLWRFVDITEATDGDKNKMHVIGREYPTKEQLLLNVERYAAEYGCEGATFFTPPRETLERIAKQYLNIPTLESRNSDSLDFYDLGVIGIRYALEAAWKAGKEAQ